MTRLCMLAMTLLCAGAHAAARDSFSAMGVRRVVPPRPVDNVLLHGADGQGIPLAGLRGKVVVLEFFLPS